MRVRFCDVRSAVSSILIVCSLSTFAFSQGIATSGPTPPPEFKKAIDQFNADIAVWNARCKITRSEAEDAWCKKERARIGKRKAELIALGAIPR
ncbi:MAG: hypothetical protein QOG51_1666 [Verrucomicrobiota bacterium]|jgi:hypothetical protein